jgi:hypothetical protein
MVHMSAPPYQAPEAQGCGHAGVFQSEAIAGAGEENSDVSIIKKQVSPLRIVIRFADYSAPVEMTVLWRVK